MAEPNFSNKGKKMTIAELENAFLSYFEKNVISVVPGSLQRFSTWFALGAQISKLENDFRQKFAGTLIEGETVNWNELKKAVEFAFEKEPKITIGAFTFNKNDFDEFRKIAEASTSKEAKS